MAHGDHGRRAQPALPVSVALPVSRSGVPRARCLGRSGASDDPSVLWRQEGVLVVQ